MSVNLVLLLILYLALRVIVGTAGTTAFVSLGLNSLLMFVTVILIRRGVSIIGSTLVASLFISCVNLFMINGYERKTRIAFKSSLVILISLIPLIYLGVNLLQVQGLGKEELFEMDIYSLEIGLDFIKVSIAVIVMSTIGAVNDLAISITSALSELVRLQPELTGRKIFHAGLSIGRDILATTVNTLFFALLGGNLALLIWLRDLNYSLAEVVNHKVLVSGLLTLLFSGLGAILVIPLTAYFMSRELARETEKRLGT